MFTASKLVTMLEWEPMSTHAEVASIVMMDRKFIVQKDQCSPLIKWMRMVVSQKEDIPITLLSMKGKYSLMLLRTFSSFVFRHHLVVSAECLKCLLTLAWYLHLSLLNSCTC